MQSTWTSNIIIRALEYLESRESEVVDIIMQLYDQEEIMKVHDIRVARDSAIRATVEMCQEFDLSFADVVDKIVKMFSMSYEGAEDEVKEYWQD